MELNYLIFMGGPLRTAAEQQEQDRLAGEAAAAIAGLWRSLTRPRRGAKRPVVRVTVPEQVRRAESVSAGSGGGR